MVPGAALNIAMVSEGATCSPVIAAIIVLSFCFCIFCFATQLSAYRFGDTKWRRAQLKEAAAPCHGRGGVVQGKQLIRNDWLEAILQDYAKRLIVNIIPVKVLCVWEAGGIWEQMVL